MARKELTPAEMGDLADKYSVEQISKMDKKDYDEFRSTGKVSAMETEQVEDKKQAGNKGIWKKILAVSCAVVATVVATFGVWHGVKYWGQKKDVTQDPEKIQELQYDLVYGSKSIRPSSKAKADKSSLEVYESGKAQDGNFYVIYQITEGENIAFYLHEYKDIESKEEYEKALADKTLEFAGDENGKDIVYALDSQTIQTGDETKIEPVMPAKGKEAGVVGSRIHEDVEDIQNDIEEKIDKNTNVASAGIVGVRTRD